MKFVRWYDKDPYLSQMMKILERLPIQLQEAVAQDLLQIVMDRQKQNDDGKIAYLNKNLCSQYKRWYDMNPNILSSIEILRNADEPTRKEVCESVIEFLFQILAQEQAGINV